MKATLGRTLLNGFAAATLAGVVLVSGSGSVRADGPFGSVRASAQGSAMMFKGSATIIQGSGQVLVAGSQFAVESVRAVAEGVVVVLRGVTEASRITLQIVGNSVVSATMAAGKILTVSATAAGHILHAGGEVIAFVPNTLGHTLVHSSSYGDPSHPSYGHGQAQPWTSPDERQDFESGEPQ